MLEERGLSENLLWARCADQSGQYGRRVSQPPLEEEEVVGFEYDGYVEGMDLDMLILCWMGEENGAR